MRGVDRDRHRAGHGGAAHALHFRGRARALGDRVRHGHLRAHGQGQAPPSARVATYALTTATSRPSLAPKSGLALPVAAVMMLLKSCALLALSASTNWPCLMAPPPLPQRMNGTFFIPWLPSATWLVQVTMVLFSSPRSAKCWSELASVFMRTWSISACAASARSLPPTAES